MEGVRTEKYRWETDEEGKEKMGSFIWPLIDGKRTVYDIGQKVSEQFGDKAEPLYPRLTLYIRTLKEYGFIKY